ncbi:hypothetical protein [Nitrosomonas sp. Nm34]|uniref:hypothetical protein n=1 Tax=Nitrosomonas sp. Nm34 TaxID=1881055 RepID=UPI0008DEF923|nr:hypothetical protein [Nitrosomonas sp. Nm34]SFI30822.1 hypothetical protein SAMN05428978_100532 [Nitrosomonas sp. Nm34]
MNISLGMKVRFHPIIGGRHDGNLYEVRCIGKLYGRDYAWLEGKLDPVDIRSLTMPTSSKDCYDLGCDS